MKLLAYKIFMGLKLTALFLIDVSDWPLYPRFYSFITLFGAVLYWAALPVLWAYHRRAAPENFD